MLRKIVSAMARSRRGMALLPVVIGVAAVGILIYSVLRWYFSMIQGTANLEDRLEMQIITQEYLGRINAATYDELVQTAAARGSSWTEDVRDGKYEARIEIGDDGKFTDAKCDTEATIGDGDKRCRTATITLTSKSDPAQVMNLSTISVSVPSRIPEIQRRLSVQDDRFGEYYTKGEGDGHFACPWDYKMNAANTACVPCDAPTWKQYRNGNCSLYTCPTGQKANATGNGCEQIVCPSDKILQGDECVVPIRKVSDSCLYVPAGTTISLPYGSGPATTTSAGNVCCVGGLHKYGKNGGIYARFYIRGSGVNITNTGTGYQGTTVMESCGLWTRWPILGYTLWCPYNGSRSRCNRSSDD